MRLLLDTNVFLWLQTGPERLGDRLGLVSDESNELLVSAATAWEIAIKWALGKLALPAAPSLYVPDRVTRIGAAMISVTAEDALATAELPSLHRDPFDRLLVAQARVRDMTILTGDPQLGRYDAPTIVV